MQGRRIDRVSELLKRSASEVLRAEDALRLCGLVNVNEVRVAKDLQSALVFVGIIGTADQKKRAMAFLNDHAKRLQNLVGDKMQLRYTAKLKFVEDDSIERGNRVLAILDEIEKDSQA
jgi:ribosome-binding factor A